MVSTTPKPKLPPGGFSWDIKPLYSHYVKGTYLNLPGGSGLRVLEPLSRRDVGDLEIETTSFHVLYGNCILAQDEGDSTIWWWSPLDISKHGIDPNEEIVPFCVPVASLGN